MTLIKNSLFAALFLSAAALGCGSPTQPRKPVPPDDTGGSSGDGGTSGTGGSSGSSGHGGSNGGTSGSSGSGGSNGGSSGSGATGGGGSGGGGAGGADASPPDASADDAGGTDSGAPDVGPQPDAYVLNMGGPFGLNARPGPQTCKAFADATMPTMNLSDTGCVDKTDHKKPAASLIPYDVNSPLWSDGATKARFMAIPEGALIHVKDCMREPKLCMPTAMGGTTPNDGHWDLPVGTVLMKNFSFNGKLLETRLFERFSDMWYGYSYVWNATQTDAVVADQFGVHQNIAGVGGKTQDWFFPGRNDCNTCHNQTVGFSLGPETLQMNRTFAYPGGTTANQIATLEHIGLFDAPVRMMAPVVDPATTTATLDARARSYLHANCAICHRPEGDYADIDMRFGTMFKDTGLCDMPNKGDLGVPGSMRIIPGMPMKSVVYLRMTALTKVLGRMPQLATSVVDATGSKLISDWITGLPKTTCP